jgi:hypothetical protein
VFGTTPEGGKAELCVGIQKGFFEKTLLWMEELTNEGIVESRLPFLNEGHFEAAIVDSVCVDWDRSPNVQIVMVMPIAECQFGLDKSLVRELEVFSGAAVLSVESMVHCRTQIEFGLYVGDVGETDVDALWLEKLSRKTVVGV